MYVDRAEAPEREQIGNSCGQRFTSLDQICGPSTPFSNECPEQGGHVGKVLNMWSLNTNDRSWLLAATESSTVLPA